MKERIKTYFEADRSYQNGVQLVMELSNNIAIKRQLNVHPQSKYMEGIMQEELRRLADIPRDDFSDMLLLPVKEKSVEPVEVKVQVADQGEDAPEEQAPKKAGRKK